MTAVTRCVIGLLLLLSVGPVIAAELTPSSGDWRIGETEIRQSDDSAKQSLALAYSQAYQDGDGASFEARRLAGSQYLDAAQKGGVKRDEFKAAYGSVTAEALQQFAKGQAMQEIANAIKDGFKGVGLNIGKDQVVDAVSTSRANATRP